MKTGIDPRVDYAFKKIFGSEANTPVLLDLLDAVLSPPPDQRIVEVELLNPFAEKDAPDDKVAILDIKARDQLGRLLNIEMQMCGSPVFLHRLLYYWALLHASQLREGDNYAKLRPTISISFVNTVMFPKVADHHLDFKLHSAQHPQLIFSNQLSVHLVELPKFRLAAEELADPLEQWCYFLNHGGDLDPANLPVTLNRQAVHRAMEVLNMLSKNDLERERYQARVKFERDRVSFLEEARDEALKKGHEEGREEGIKIAIAPRIQFYEKMLRLPPTNTDELLRLSIAELEAKAMVLEEQLVPRET